MTRISEPVDAFGEDFAAKPLAAKLAAVMEHVERVPKNGWNDFHRYNYVMEADLVATIRPLLAKAGIIIIPNTRDVVWDRDVIQERNGLSSMCRVMVEYTVTDGKESFAFSVPGFGVDRSDKSIYKALTGSMKYALMKLFLVDTGDDPERTTGEERGTRDVTISDSAEPVGKGGKSEKTTRYQMQRMVATMREKGLDRGDLLAVITKITGVDLVLPEEDPQTVIAAFIADLPSDQAGNIISALETMKESDAATE